MPPRTCIDASFALTWIFPDNRSIESQRLRAQWTSEGVDLIAPPIFAPEVTSVIRERAYRGEISAADSREFLEHALAWPITVLHAVPGLQVGALDLATRFNRPKAYDAQYLALASSLGCELWTADSRLANTVGRSLPWVRAITAAP